MASQDHAPDAGAVQGTIALHPARWPVRYRRNLLTRVQCWAGFHPRLHIIQRFGAAAHVACPYCEREFAMHDGVRAFVHWDGEFEDMYERFGFDVKGQRQAWLLDKHPLHAKRAPLRAAQTADAVPGMNPESGS